MNEKELLDLEFAKYIPLIEEARKNGKNKFEYNGCSVEYYKKLDGEELNITNAQRDNRGIVKEGPEINIDFGKNGDKRIAYIGHCPKVPWSDDYTIIFVEISQYKDNITYMGNGIYSNMDALNFKDRKVNVLKKFPISFTKFNSAPPTQPLPTFKFQCPLLSFQPKEKIEKPKVHLILDEKNLKL